MEENYIISPPRYESSHDVGMRLKGTIVSWKKRPVYVETVAGDGVHVVIRDLLTWTKSVVHSSDSRLDISCLHVGWVNWGDFCSYLMRDPKNSQRQGLVPQNMSVMSIERGQNFTNGFYLEEPTMYKTFGQAILGVYPDFEECVLHCSEANDKRKTKKCKAFSQNYAVVQRKGFLGVYHKTVPVALYYPDDHRFLFKRGALTKTRHHELNELLYPNKKGFTYGISEQP